MASFIVEQYEVHATQYLVEGDNIQDQADAIQAVLDGDGTILNTEFVETDELRGMPTDNLSIEEGRKLDVMGLDHVSTIRTVRGLA